VPQHTNHAIMVGYITGISDISMGTPQGANCLCGEKGPSHVREDCAREDRRNDRPRYNKGATYLVMLEVDMDATVVAATPPCELLSPARYERRPHCK
jgi:hypothetical protein